MIAMIATTCLDVSDFMRAVATITLLAAAVAAISAFEQDSPPPAKFVEAGSQSGLAFRFNNSPTRLKYLIETMGGGVAVFDFDNDGWADIFLVNGAALKNPQPDTENVDKSAPEYWNRLFRNNHDGTFTDVTIKAGLQGRGYGMGVATGDFDNDGFTDLLVTNYGGAVLYHNNGDGTFTDITQKARIETSGWTTGAGFFDYDGDGFLDIVIARYLDWNFAAGAMFCGTNVPGGRSYCHPDEFKPVSNYLFHNNRDGTFSDVSVVSGLAAVKGKALGLAFGDYDDDGRLDVYIANDSAPQMLFHNNGDGTFTESATNAGVAYTEDGKSFSGMGTVFADVDNDGLPDILTTALPYEYYAFFRNIGKGQFQYSSVSSRLAMASRPFGGWGIHVFDFENDGANELFLANAHVMDNIEISQPHLRSDQTPLLLRYSKDKFLNISETAGEVFKHAWAARGAAFGDLDNDGDIDAVVTDYHAPTHLLWNEGGNRNHWIGLDLRGTASNRDAIGAKVRLTTGSGKRLYALVSTAGSYLSANDRRVIFGLGRETTVREVQIRWPSGAEQLVASLQFDKMQIVIEPAKEQSNSQTSSGQEELERGISLARQGKTSSALAAFRESVRLNPDLVEGHFSLGVMLARMGRQYFAEALAQFLEVLRRHPSDVDAHINLSNLMEEEKNLTGSVAEMRKAVSLASNKADLLVILGEKQNRAFLYNEAAESLRAALNQDPALVRARYGLGIALRHLRDTDHASTEFEALLKADPNNADALFELGLARADQERYDESAQLLESVVRLRPRGATPYFELGRIYRRMGRAEEAADALRKGLALKPDEAPALYQLAKVSQDPQEASRLYATIRELQARTAQTAEAVDLNQEGMRLLAQGNSAKALEAFRRAVTADPGFVVAAYNVGVVLSQRGETDEAIKAFRETIRIDASFPAAHYGLGLLLKSRGEPAASTEFQTAEMLEAMLAKSGGEREPGKPAQPAPAR